MKREIRGRTPPWVALNNGRLQRGLQRGMTQDEEIRGTKGEVYKVVDGEKRPERREGCA